MLTIAIDMDEVIADAAKKLKAWYQRDYRRVFTETELYGKNLDEAVPSVRAGVFHQYANTPGFFRDLEIMSGADSILEQINKNYGLYLVSAAMEFPNSLKDKFDWIEEKLPFITWKQICLCGSKSIIQTDIMIDDRIRNFRNFKGRKILYSAHHNMLETGYERVNNWREIEEKLL